MEAGSEQFVEAIANSAKSSLTKSSLGITYAVQEQGGVKIAEDDTLKLSPERQTQITSLLGITELTSQLRHTLFEQASQGLMTDSSKKTPEQTVITNQDKFTKELLGNNPKLLDKLAEITAKARVFDQVLQEQAPSSTTEQLGIKVAAWEHTIDGIAQCLCSNEAERTYYQSLVESNLVRLNNPTTKTVIGTDSQPLTMTQESYAQKLGKLIRQPRAVRLMSSFLEPRQGEKLADNLGDEYLETAFTLNAVRVLDRIQRPLTFNGKYRKLVACLEEREVDPAYTQIIESNNFTEDFNKLRDKITQISKSLLLEDEDEVTQISKFLLEFKKEQKIQELNDQFKDRCRSIVEGFFNKDTDTDEAVDLVGAKQRIAALQQQAQEIRISNLEEAEKRQRLAHLDQQAQALLVPIANKVERVFPHQSFTNLTEVLEEEDAVCAGKVNVLLAISKYLGINARANSVKEILDNGTAGHVCFECDLPSGAKLVIDANFENRFGLDGKTDDELVARIRKNNPGITDPELESSLRYTKLAIVNARFIPTNSRVLTYMTENTGQVVTNEQQLQETRQNPHLLIRINPYSGQKEIWKASIPYPHLITSPDKDGYLFINSSFTSNTGHFVTEDYTDVGVYLFRKHIEISPYDARAYTGLAGLLPKEEGIAFLERAKKEKPNLYWEGMSAEHALMYAYQGDFDRVSQIFEETRLKNPRAYYKSVHYLSRQFVNQAEKETGEAADQHRARALSLMEQACRENPTLFYSDSSNIWELTWLYDDQIEKKIEVYEEFRRVQEANFWNAVDYSPPFQQLMEFYLEQGKKDSIVRIKAVEFANEIKTREKRFYAKRVYSYALGLYLEGEQKDPTQAIAMLEEVRVSLPEMFFQENNNVTTLTSIYEGQEDYEKAISIYEEFRGVNPDLFWNKKKYVSTYKKLVHLYTGTNQRDKAIAICEEAKAKSDEFWQPSYSDEFWKPSYSGGYIQLVSLYSEAGRLPEAIAISVEAQTKDSTFFNPKSANGGYTQLASLYSEAGQIDEAISTMLQGQETDEGFWTREYGTPNVFKLVDIYEKSGQIYEAISILEQVKDRNVSYWKTDYYRICGLYEKSGQIEKARQIRRRLVSIYEELKSSDLYIYYPSTEKLAILYLSEGQTQKAIQTFEEGKEHYRYFPIRSIVTLAELYMQVGDEDKARSAYQEAIEDYKKFGRPENVSAIIQRARERGIEVVE